MYYMRKHKPFILKRLLNYQNQQVLRIFDREYEELDDLPKFVHLV
jgi:hypothetical protein